jgi:hypothetical protein
MTDTIPTILNNYINEGNTLETSLIKLYKDVGVHTKHYKDDKLILLYHPFGHDTRNNDLLRNCRSLVITEDFKTVANTGNEPYINNDGVKYLIKESHNNVTMECHESFRGTMFSFFYYNDKWYASTRRCLDSKESKFNNIKSHYDLLVEVLENNNDTFETFTNKLNTSLSYYAVMLHHEIIDDINYVTRFGEQYKKLCIVAIKDTSMRHIPLNIMTLLTDTIITPPIVDLASFTNPQSPEIIYNTIPTSEGVIITITKNNFSTIVKLQNLNFQFYSACLNKNMYKGFIFLYQKDKLTNFITTNYPSECLIINPKNTYEKYDIIITIDALFKCCAQEFFELFKILWDIKNGKSINNDLYNICPKEYKHIFYIIRGLYFSKKSTFFDNRAKAAADSSIMYDNAKDFMLSHLKVADVYNILKSLPIDILYNLLHSRKLIQNTSRQINNNSIYKHFNTITFKCTRIHIKLSAIITNLMFPNISSADIIH